MYFIRFSSHHYLSDETYAEEKLKNVEIDLNSTYTCGEFNERSEKIFFDLIFDAILGDLNAVGSSILAFLIFIFSYSQCQNISNTLRDSQVLVRLFFNFWRMQFWTF